MANPSCAIFAHYCCLFWIIQAAIILTKLTNSSVLSSMLLCCQIQRGRNQKHHLLFAIIGLLFVSRESVKWTIKYCDFRFGWENNFGWVFWLCGNVLSCLWCLSNGRSWGHFDRLQSVSIISHTSYHQTPKLTYGNPCPYHTLSMVAHSMGWSTCLNNMDLS